MEGHTAPYHKMEPTNSVRRPESGTWQSLAMKSAAMGGRTGTHDTLWTWQQQEEAVQGPMADMDLAAAVAVEAAVFGSHTQA
ncbi:unnamed protein product [Staurois parvus]|uniref:Uncharacterized protein n=1 Tax=Staurois parvus TaxID=386267 RepID=A0ABN9BHB8_9NEOB|nr:unnamed protein product [Staurois parvus]